MAFDATTFFRFSVAAIATWRLAFLLARERGPADIFVHLRRAVGHGVFAELLTCVKCVGVWLAIPFAFFVRGDWVELVVIWLALAGVTALIDEWTRPPFEWRDANDDEVVGDPKRRDVEGVK
jgi:hypothetical protein